jgi:arginase
MALAMLGAPIGDGAGRRGCEAGPHALRAAGIREALMGSGRAVVDHCDLRPDATADVQHANGALKALPQVAAWAGALYHGVRALPRDDIPVILGGDHSLSLGTLPALAARAAAAGRSFHVLWIDAHPDCHTLDSSTSGNLHGLPVAHALGANGVGAPFPGDEGVLKPANLTMVGIRDVDAAEAAFIAERRIAAHGPATLRMRGAAAILGPWLDRIVAEGGHLHVSLDADALDPALAPGVGTPVPDGLAAAEVREIMDLVAAADVLGSLELVEVNPFLDRGGRTAQAMVELAAAAVRRPQRARLQGRADA